ncbi:MAG: winged helix-turn-helix domain-containing protein, partial [Bacteroidia bacterium]
MSVPPTEEPMRFERFELRPAERLLLVDGTPAAIGARAFDLLLALAQRHGRLVGKQELLDQVWPGLVVEEHNIATQIGTLRKLLGAPAITTVAGRGYRLTAARGDAAAPATVAAPGAATHLPRELTPLLGRSDDLAAVMSLLQRYRLVTLVGAGGMGKSLLAQHALSGRGTDFAQGICWVELASVGDAAELPARIAHALGVRPAAGEPLAGLCAAVTSMSMLVALDNAKHLLADAARTVAALLAAAP